MNYIEAINWQGKKIPEAKDQPEKTVFLAERFSPKNANLVLYPLNASPAAHLERIASFTGIPGDMLKTRLSGRGFMMLKRSENAEDIAECLNALNQHGYTARMLRDDMFFRVPVPRRVIGLEWHRESAVFTLPGAAQPVEIPRNEPVFCVIADLRSTKRLAGILQNDSNPPPLPYNDKFTFKSIIEGMNTWHCDIYLPYKWLAIRIESDKFNFTCLGNTAAKNAADNLALLLERLRAMPLNMVWDDRFPETAVIGMKSQFEFATSSASLASASLTANSAELPFNFYSRFRYILELAAGLKCFS